jgi:GDPmannose 4,6-dehydratase
MVVEQKPPICLVLGVNGQDGSFLAERLLAEGYCVVGVGRQDTSRWISSHCPNFTYCQYDLSDAENFPKLVESFSPDYIYHAAAIHGSAGFDYEEVWYSAHAVNTLITHAALEYCRANVKCRFIYLSSSKVFNYSDGDLITEGTTKKSDCIYSITKNSSSNLIEYYRKRHGVSASIVYTFNHESIRRNRDFFIPKIVNILQKSIGDHRYREDVYSLSFFCDWGCAKEYMDLVFEISSQAIGNDFVVATGNTLFGKDFVSELFSRYGLRAEDHVNETSAVINQNKFELPWKVSCEKLKRYTSRAPLRGVYEICDEILNLN